jgi:putative membrane protein
MLIVFSIVMFIFKSNINITYVLIFYFVYFLLITIVLLNYNLFVIEESKSIKAGVTDISIYSNLSKLLGFSLGSYIYKVNIEEYLIVFIIVFILFSSLKINNFKNKTEKNSERLVFNDLKRKYIIVNTALLSGAAVFFIPMFIKQLAARNLIQYSSIVFFIPGLTVVLFLILTKKYEINLNNILISYIILDMVFFIFVICKVFLPLQVVLLSLIVALGVSISIKLRTNFIKINNKEYRKSILQIFRISAPLFTIVLSLIGLYLENIAYYILLINILSAGHVLWVNVRKNKVIL